jgi:hypothetical protein
MKIEYIEFVPHSDNAGNDVVTIQYEQTLLQKIMKKPAVRKVYYGNCTVWHDADNGRRAGTSLEGFLAEKISFMKHKGVKKCK